MRDGKIAYLAGTVMIITIIGKIMGLIRDRMQAITFGANTAESIAFAQASILPRSFLDIMLSAAFSASFIPVFNSVIEQKGEKAALKLAAIFTSVVFVLTCIISITGILFSESIFRVSLGGGVLPEGTVALGAVLLRIMFPLIMLSGIAFSFTGVLQSMGEFRIPAAMGIVSNGIILIYYFFFIERFGVYGLAVAFLVGFGAQGLIQIPFLVKKSFPFKLHIDLRDSGLRQIGTLAIPVLVASWVMPINILVNARAVAPLYDGEFGVNAIYYANTIYLIISGVFILSLTNIIFPKISKQIANNELDGFKETVGDTLQVMVFFLLPLTLGMMVLAEPLVELVFGGGLFGDRAVEVTKGALFFFAPGIIGYGFMMLLTRACYALRDGRTPMIAAVVAIATNIFLSFFLASVMSVRGVALAGAVSQTLGALILVFFLTKQGVLVWQTTTILSLLRLILLAGVMLVGVILVSSLTGDRHSLIVLAATGATGLIVYLGLAYLLGIKEMKWMLGFFHK